MKIDKPEQANNIHYRLIREGAFVGREDLIPGLVHSRIDGLASRVGCKPGQGTADAFRPRNLALKIGHELSC